MKKKNSFCSVVQFSMVLGAVPISRRRGPKVGTSDIAGGVVVFSHERKLVQCIACSPNREFVELSSAVRGENQRTREEEGYDGSRDVGGGEATELMPFCPS